MTKFICESCEEPMAPVHGEFHESGKRCGIFKHIDDNRTTQMCEYRRGYLGIAKRITDEDLPLDHEP